jgi:hypothetical protein
MEGRGGFFDALYLKDFLRFSGIFHFCPSVVVFFVLQMSFNVTDFLP